MPMTMRIAAPPLRMPLIWLISASSSSSDTPSSPAYAPNSPMVSPMESNAEPAATINIRTTAHTMPTRIVAMMPSTFIAMGNARIFLSMAGLIASRLAYRHHAAIMDTITQINGAALTIRLLTLKSRIRPAPSASVIRLRAMAARRKSGDENTALVPSKIFLCSF